MTAKVDRPWEAKFHQVLPFPPFGFCFCADQRRLTPRAVVRHLDLRHFYGHLFPWVLSSFWRCRRKPPHLVIPSR